MDDRLLLCVASDTHTYTGAALSIALANWNMLFALVFFIRVHRNGGLRTLFGRCCPASASSASASTSASASATSSAAGNVVLQALSSKAARYAPLSSADSVPSTPASAADGGGVELSALPPSASASASANDAVPLHLSMGDSSSAEQAEAEVQITAQTPAHNPKHFTPSLLSTSLQPALDTWPALSREALKGWRQFLALAIPGAASMFIEWYVCVCVCCDGMSCLHATASPHFASLLSQSVITLTH
jgi:hypothetical protein